MKQLPVVHSKGSYTIWVGHGLLNRAVELAAVGNRRVVIVTDNHVAVHWLDPLRAAFSSPTTLVLPAGEPSKTLSTVELIWQHLAANGARRDTVLIALGGGVIGDMTGFAAACWMRGVDFIQVPTTLLAQVDASVGGKTGVDLPDGKNLVGAFHQPAAVLIDTDTLDTLPGREFAAGLAEVVKTALIEDERFLDDLEADADALTKRDKVVLEEVIARCCNAKARIVQEDEREHGVRALLNLGHTFAHAIETSAGYDRFLHGEAVAIGLVLACRLSERELGLDPALTARVSALLKQFDLPITPPADIDPARLLDAMRLDKKHAQSGWRFVLLERAGKATVREFASPEPVMQLLGDPNRSW